MVYNMYQPFAMKPNGAMPSISWPVSKTQRKKQRARVFFMVND